MNDNNNVTLDFLMTIRRLGLPTGFDIEYYTCEKDGAVVKFNVLPLHSPDGTLYIEMSSLGTRTLIYDGEYHVDIIGDDE